MTLKAKRFIIGALGATFLGSLLFVQQMEVIRKRQETGLAAHYVAVPANSKACVDCHRQTTPGIIDHWTGSTHAAKGVGCVECHKADAQRADGYDHYGERIVTVVTPMDCGRCHAEETKEFMASHHAKAGNILASLDNFLADTVEGSKMPFNPHSPTPGMTVEKVNGMSSVNVGCKQCHGGKVALQAIDGSLITVDQLKPDAQGHPTALNVVKQIKYDASHKPILDSSGWPNTGIGRLNLDGSRGSCSACHSRHDFSPRRARQPENCSKCHLGPDHPQKEIYDESKHGVAFRDLKDHMNLDAPKWVLGEDYSQAPTCATCHMSANTRNGRKVTHDPGHRISWTNRPPVSLLLDTDANGEVVKETDPEKRKALVVEDWHTKRARMVQVCTHCHTENYVNAFYQQYDEFVINYNEKFAKPGLKIMSALTEQKLLTKQDFDAHIKWTWYLLWHHEGRRARHGASMMAPDYAHWHGMFEVAQCFYEEFIPEARALCDQAEKSGKGAEANAVRKVIDEILARPEHAWYTKQPNKQEGSAQPAVPPPAKEPVRDSPREPAS